MTDTIQNLPNYIGTCKVKKDLTKKLNYKNWIIYRDSENGIYLYNIELDEEINPYLWNITSKEWSENTRETLIRDINTFMEEEYKGEYIPKCNEVPTKLTIHLC